MALQAEQPLQLEHVLGFNPTTLTVLHHDPARRGYRLAYGSGSVVVLCDTLARAQTLLRGHRDTVSACLASPDRALLVTADAAEGGGCSILLWDPATGAPLAMVEAPHAAGTLALAWAGGGPRPRYLVTLSAPHEATAGGRQEVAVWDCAGAWAALQGGGGGGGDPSPALLASTPVPLAAGRQAHLAINPSPSPLVGRKGPLGAALGLAAQCAPGPVPVPSAPATLGTVHEGWEMATSPGSHGAPGGAVVFFSALHVGITERVKGQGGKPSTTVQHAVWHVTASAALSAGARRALTVSAFLPGASAPALNTRDELAGAVGAATDTAGAAGAARLVLSAGSATRVVAVSGTREGALAQWVQAPQLPAPSHSALEDAAAEETLSSRSAALTRKALLKLVRVARPAYQNLARGITAPAPDAEAVTCLAPVPSGLYFLLGTADGCVRLYDLHVRLLAWWEDLGGGGVLALPTAAVAGDAQAAGAGAQAAPHAQADEATLRALNDTPQFLACTERALAIALTPLEFLLPEGAAERSGELVLEGPGADVADLAVFSPSSAGEGGEEPQESLLAVALCSGCVHVWSPTTRSLLLVRDLAVPSDLLHAGCTGVYTPTVLAADPLHRALAVGTATGFLLLLDPGSLGDTQPPLPPATWELPVAEGGRCPSSPITHAAFSPDGYHLATADAAGYVSLYRYTQRMVRRPASSTSALTARNMLLLRKPWVGIIPEADKWVESVSSVWAFVGRARAHAGSGGSGRALSGLAFSPPLSSPAARDMVQGAVASGLIGPGTPTPLPTPCPAPTVLPFSGVPHRTGGTPWWSTAAPSPVVTDVRHAACGLSLLISSGLSDRRVVVYDVGGSSEGRGLVMRQGGGGEAPGGGVGGGAGTGAGTGAAARQSYRLSTFQRTTGGEGGVADAAPLGGAAVHFLPLGSSPSPSSSRPSCSTQVEQSANVTALAWLPYAEDWEDCKGSGAPAMPRHALPPLLLANDAFKLRLWSSGGSGSGSGSGSGAPSVAHQRTVQGPVFGGNVTRILCVPTLASLTAAANRGGRGRGLGSAGTGTGVGAGSGRGGGAFDSPGRPSGSRGRGTGTGTGTPLPCSEEKRSEDGAPAAPSPLTYYAAAYATDDRVIGLLALPLDGSPFGQTGVVAHEGPVSALALCPTGRLFSAGGGSVSVWRVSEGGCKLSGGAGPAGLAQFLGAMPAEEHNRLRDAFSYALIHSQGEASSAPRAGGKSLPLPQLPTLLRGCGFFPTAWEEELVMEEARALCQGQLMGQAQQPSVDLPNGLRLLVNHRPTRAATPQALCDAAGAALEEVLAAAGVPLEAVPEGEGGGQGEGQGAQGVRWGHLATLLSTLGDAIPRGQLATIMGTLLESEEGAGNLLLTQQLSSLVQKYGAPAAALPGALLGKGAGRRGRGGAGGAGAVEAALPRLSAPPLADDALVEPAQLAAILRK